MKLVTLASAILLLVTGVAAQTVPPAIFFTDLTSGPNSGGESVGGFAGAYVTIYGNNFGSSQGSSTVTWNGQNCLRVVPATGSYSGWGAPYLWYQKIVVQLGSSCTPGTGNFVVTVNGQASSFDTGHGDAGGSFTVRSSGNIYCVSTAGSNSNSGHFPNCWQTMVQGRQIQPGDITYVENGVSQTSNDGYASLTVAVACNASMPCAMVTYPGATATIGSTSNDGIRFCASGLSACGTGGNYWTFAGFTLRGNQAAMSSSPGVTNIYLIGNDVSCPSGNQSTGCITTNQVGNVYLYGNNVHNAGTHGSSIKTYHAIYLGGDATPLYPGNFIAWNSVHDVGGCRGIQIRPNTGNGIWDVHIHDNLLYNIACDAINLGGVDPTSGPVEAYNNVMYNYGNDSGCSYGATYGGIRTGPSSIGGSVSVYNNTIGPNNGNCNNGDAGNIIVQQPTTLWNNIMLQTSPVPYWVADASVCSSILSGSTKNLFYGSGTPPCTSNFSNSLNVNPQLVNPYPSGTDFHLSSASSPANGASTTTPPIPAHDHDGLIRPQPPSIGAYEFASSSSSSVTRPNPPTNLAVAVN